MRDYKKKILHIGLIIVMVAAVLGFTGITADTYAVTDDKNDGIYFEEPYAEAGKTLTVKYDGEETDLVYKWYVDDQLLSPVEDEEKTETISNTLEITAEYYQKNIRVEVWAGENIKLGEASIFCSKLPVLYIDTEGGAEVVSKEDYLDAQMHLQGNSQYNSSSSLYTGATEIKGRGNSSWRMFPKKPYRLKLDKKADLLGLGKSKHWVLLANYLDETGMRNMLAGQIATRMNVGAMDGTWVEVVMNGENLGMYMLCEHVRLAEDRVNVFDWESAAEDIAEAIADANGYTEDEMEALTDFMAEEDMTWISTGEVVFNGKTHKTADYYEGLPASFSGGYLLEMDLGYDEVSKFTTDNGAPIMFKSPEFICTDPIAMDTVTNFIQTFEDALYSEDFNTTVDDKSVSYTELCDMNSLAGFWLSSEMLINEIGYKSTYFQKDIDQPLVFGPVWDFDYSSASVTPFGSHDSTDWTSDNKVKDTNGDKWWFDKVMKDPYFAVKVRNEFLEQEEYFKEIIAEEGVLKQWHDYLKESGEYNYNLWQYARGFEADYETLHAWLTERINWMDEQFATNETAMKSMGIELSDNIFMELQGESVELNNDKSYSAEIGSQNFELAVSVDGSECLELNYYINSRYQGTVPLADGKTNIVIREEQLTEDTGKDNVITVWLKDGNGQLAEQQYLTVKLISEQPVYNVVFNDMGGTYSQKVVAGEKVFIDGPQQQDDMTIFEGWSDGENLYKTGKWIAVNSDITFNAVWAICSDGSYNHNLAEKDDVLECINDNCQASKPSNKAYKKITSCALTCSSRYDNYYTGKEIKPAITVSDGEKLLTEGKEYTVEFSNTVNAGYGLYTIKGIKSEGYCGEVMLSYRIIARSITKAKLIMPTNCLLEDGVADPDISLTYNGMILVKDKDYILDIKDNTKAGTATLTITGIGNFTNSLTKTFNVVESAKRISTCTFTSISNKAYTGKAVKPSLTIKDNGRRLVAGVDYTATYSNNVKCGTASVKVTGISKNGYSGSETVQFKIRPAKVTPKVSNVKYNQQKVTWSKVTGATSYKVYFSKNNKTYKLVKTVKASASRSYTSKGLDAGNTYYYKVRAIRTSNGTTYWGIKGDAAKLKTVLYKGEITYCKNTAPKTVTLKWTAVNGAHGYKIYRSKTGKSGSFELIKTAKYMNQYKNTGLTKGKTYYYKVKPYRKVNGKMVYGKISPASKVKITK